MSVYIARRRNPKPDPLPPLDRPARRWSQLTKKKTLYFFPDLLFFFCVLLIYPKDGISVSDFCNGEQRKQQQQRK